jgi:propionate CoA-transferase
MKSKVVTASEAIELIKDDDIVAASGFVGTGTPDELFCALENRFLQTQSPR